MAWHSNVSSKVSFRLPRSFKTPLREFLNCVHAKSEFYLWCNEVTCKVNGMMPNCVWRHNGSVVQRDHRKLTHGRDSYWVHRVFAQVQNMQLQWFNHTQWNLVVRLHVSGRKLVAPCVAAMKNLLQYFICNLIIHMQVFFYMCSLIFYVWNKPNVNSKFIWLLFLSWLAFFFSYVCKADATELCWALTCE